MEELTGFEVLKKIKRVNPNIYVVMVSAQDNIKTAVDALKYGAFDYVIKDQQVNDNMLKIVSKITKVKEALTQNSNIIKRIFSLF
jgi:DNA-binding NtrC family response regulator